LKESGIAEDDSRRWAQERLDCSTAPMPGRPTRLEALDRRPIIFDMLRILVSTQVSPMACARP
jgi:hypothetical protein